MTAKFSSLEKWEASGNWIIGLSELIMGLLALHWI